MKKPHGGSMETAGGRYECEVHSSYTSRRQSTEMRDQWAARPAFLQLEYFCPHSQS